MKNAKTQPLQRKKMIKISEDAKIEIPETLKKNPGKMIRVFISGFGWGGPTLGLALDEPNKNETHTYNGIEVLIDKQTKAYLSPSIIDCFKSDVGDCQLFIQSQYSGC